MNHSRNARQRRELVRGRFRVHAREFRQQRALPNRGKTDETDSAIARFCDVKPFAFSAGFSRRFDEFPTELR
jgi:hypothetical protein